MQDIPIALISVADRLRPVDMDWAAAIAASIQAKGQDTPIVVRALPLERDQLRQHYALVAGAHRLEACRMIGAETIRAEIRTDMSDDQARLTEIDENLMRRELSALDRALFLAERKAVWERLYPETKRGGDGKYKEKLKKSKTTTCRFGFLPETFTKEAAAKTGLTDRTIQRSINLAQSLDPAVIAHLRATGLADNAAQLKALTLEPADQQLKIAEALATGQAKNIRAAKLALGLAAPVETDRNQTTVNKLLDLWTRATPKARRIFLERIGVEEVTEASEQAA